MSQYITTSGLKTTLTNYTSSLKKWITSILPFKKDEDGIKISANESFENSLEIKKNGMIYIVGTNHNTINLQAKLDTVGTIVCKNHTEAQQYIKEEYKGSLIYIEEGDVNNTPGLYTISKNLNTGTWILTKLGTTTSSEVDLGERVDKLEQFTKDIIENEKIDEIINK